MKQQLNGQPDLAMVRQLNDTFRHTFCGGRLVMTRSIADLPEDDQATLLEQVRTFSAFTRANDPHGEHDFGSFVHGDVKYFWKIDYYDADGVYGSDNRADPLVTTRVLTIMRADEY
ncbi:DUF3768 domain-containing protein [Bradyrhizobium sp. LA7.1]|uniref:DUF3768 domain-containing protein n=1 Tax=Bradyrhizobium sp. LA7.1 TaxID=3156324 RepID=UPI0033980BDB